MNQEVMHKIMTRLHARWDCININQVTATNTGWLVLFQRSRPSLPGFASQIEQRAMFFTCESEEHSSIIV